MKPNPDISIQPFATAYAGEFARLNKAWLEKYFFVEPIDEAMLADPQSFFLDKGGHIFFAVEGEKVVGCFALLKSGPDFFELSKMAVDESVQGLGIGQKLLVFAIEEAKRLGAGKLVLYTHSKLQPAIHLYRKNGFREVPVGDSVYKRSDMKMELVY
ncbi:GNAT family N-acetyltransferase [Flavihumibacter rivuli]|uniref:GNAT family N-acetyltransferase n=1 Tax=Flavihumibacter rivuli TaxID=2838156 RepID=UPI001BDF560C|nr:GNAT family N-acetyltransferase [Flavihumibacter rivuli]ULQ57229.1 GNAT family N-acetyltransferase [Flavihumibacter rivuli]